MVKRQRIFLILLLGFVVVVYLVKFHCFSNSKSSILQERLLPIVFVGGFPRSGTTLMRVLLDTHPKIRCGQETHVIPKLLLHVGSYNKVQKHRLEAAGVTEDVLDTAVASFILHVIKNHGEPAPILCNKDPLSLRNTTYLSKLFPNAKFILMVRDGRAVINSILSRHVVIRGLRNRTYENLLQRWNKAVTTMVEQCEGLGPRRCVTVYYEHLVMDPARTMAAVLRFVGVKWNDQVLHHEEFMKTPQGPAVSR